MVSETVEKVAQEGAATAETQDQPTIPAAAESQALETQAAPVVEAPAVEPSATERSVADIKAELAETQKILRRLERENKGLDRTVSLMAGPEEVQAAHDRVDLKEARDADKEEGRDVNSPDSLFQKTLAAITNRNDLAELDEAMEAMGAERNADGAFVVKTPQDAEIAKAWAKNHRTAIRLANKYARQKAREEAATMTTTTTPKPASTNGAAAAAPAKTFTEAELKAEREKAAKDAVDQARKEWLKGGALETTPSTARGGDNKQELVNRFARGEPMSDDEIKEASNAMDNGVLPKRRP